MSGNGTMGVDIVDVLAPSLVQKETDFETQLTNKIIATVFVTILFTNFIVLVFDRTRRS
jgi:hypothetical protein